MATSEGGTPGSDAGRATIKIRNVRESVVYHLLFDGDIGKLTGAQLKTHINAICGVPTEQQLLTYNGLPLHNTSSGYSVDLKPGGMLLMDYVDRAGSATAPPAAVPTEYSQAGGSTPNRSRYGAQSQRSPGARSAMSAPPYNPNDDVSMQSNAPQQDLNQLEQEIERIRRQEEDILRRQDELRRGRSAISYGSGAAGGHNTSSYPSYAVTGLNDEVDVDVEVMEEDDRVAWHPTSSVDVEETRTLQQDYVWKMEQVRFETERMNRQREMRRQQQELEYAAELLDRDRVELERRTYVERVKFESTQRQMSEDMSIQARFVPRASYE